MPTPLFSGLIVDENGKPVSSGFIGNEPAYVIDDAGFKRHIPSEQVDRAVLNQMAEMMKGSEDLLSDQAAKMLGQNDPFSKAMIENQLKNIEKQFDAVLQTGFPEEMKTLQTGFPEEMKTYLGMMGFKVIINYHGEVVRVEQPGAAGDEGE
ncbi:MAG: hypothetical protein EDM79_12685 [Chloroflexi bacterium]|nr:MAG: hypothetical protein EDM79_12685 [Chloroflexota bacterium]